MPADHRQGHVDVLGPGQVAVDPQEAVAVLGADVEGAGAADLGPVVGLLAVAVVLPLQQGDVALVEAAAATVAVAVPVAVAAPPAALALLVVPAVAAALVVPVAVAVPALLAVAALLLVALGLLAAAALGGLAAPGLLALGTLGGRAGLGGRLGRGLGGGLHRGRLAVAGPLGPGCRGVAWPSPDPSVRVAGGSPELWDSPEPWEASGACGAWAWATSPLLLGSVRVAGGAPAAAGWPPLPETSTGVSWPSPPDRLRRRVRRSGASASAASAAPAPGSSGWSATAVASAAVSLLVAPPRRPLAGVEGTNSTPWALAMIAPIRSALRSRW
jgi:hypothetical protein